MFRQKHRVLATLQVTLTLILGLSPGLGKAQRRVPSRGPGQQIRGVLDRQVEAWSNRNLEEFMRGYWRSEDLSFFSDATKLAGWQATIERYRRRYQGEGREMGRLDFSELRIEMLGPRAAFVRGHWRLKLTTGEAGGIFMLIFRKFSDGWKIIHDHTSSAAAQTSSGGTP